MGKDELIQKYDAYVICSTLNQLVNYLPLRILNKDTENVSNIVNITMESSGNRRSFSNSDWNKNLAQVLKGNIFNKIIKSDSTNQCKIFNSDGEFIHQIELERKFKMGSYIKKFEKIKDYNKILWNITGGQRSTILAIQKIIAQRIKQDKKEDVIIYLEGNTNDIIIGTYSKNKGNVG